MTSLWERLRALDPEPDALDTPDAVKQVGARGDARGSLRRA